MLLGEFGTKLETTSDQQWLSAMVSYLDTNKMSFAYWSFNPNSGDTGGLVEDDWVTPQAAKLTALQPLLGGAPPPIIIAPTTTGPSVSTSTPSPTTARPPTSTTSTQPAPGANVTATWTLQSAWNAGYVAQFVVAAKSAVSGWSISWADPGATSVANAWGLKCTVRAGRIHCTGADWAAAISADGSVQVGLQVANSGSAPVNPTIVVG